MRKIFDKVRQFLRKFLTKFKPRNLILVAIALLLVVGMSSKTYANWKEFSTSSEIVGCDTLVAGCNLAYSEKTPLEQKFQTTGLLSLVGVKKTITFTVETRGTVTSDMNEFSAQALETLNSPNGWSRAGLVFSRVNSGGSFTLVLAEPSEVAGFSTGCDNYYSCNVGRYVIINEDRWKQGTTAWSGSIRDYRHMVVNHETGHWLGHDHRNCQAVGSSAPVMQQQSISMQGCTPNPWPLDYEVSATQI